MAKDIFFGAEARAGIMRGIDLIADAVKATLGPKGRNVVMERPFGPPRISKDGVSVAREITVEPHAENLGVQMIREVAQRTSDDVGDGTTTATVLAQAIARHGLQATAAGMNPMDLRRGLERATMLILEELKRRARPLATTDDIVRVATISANGDAVVARLIGEAMDKVGRDGVIVVEDGRGRDLALEVVEGMRFDGGYLSPYFVTDPDKLICVLENAAVLLHDGRMTDVTTLLPLLEEASRASRPLLIVAEAVEGECLATLVLNKLRGLLTVVAVKAPGFGERRAEALQDMAALLGGGLMSPQLGTKLDAMSLDRLGSVRRVEVGREKTTLIGGRGRREQIDRRIAQIRTEIETAVGTQERERLRRRLAALAGGIAVLTVGADTEPEMKERKDRIEDALHATQAAVEEGILPGGGAALLHAAAALKDLRSDNNDQQAGIAILAGALRAPLQAIVANTAIEPAGVIGRLIDDGRFEQGFDAQDNRFVDMIAVGIIDPLKVVRTALSAAVSVAGLLITTEAAVTVQPETD